jgi:hypothetical protein
MGDGIHLITVLSQIKEVLGETGYVAPVIMILCTGSHLVSKRHCRIWARCLESKREGPGLLLGVKAKVM